MICTVYIIIYNYILLYNYVYIYIHVYTYSMTTVGRSLILFGYPMSHLIIMFLSRRRAIWADVPSFHVQSFSRCVFSQANLCLHPWDQIGKAGSTAFSLRLFDVLTVYWLRVWHFCNTKEDPNRRDSSSPRQRHPPQVLLTSLTHARERPWCKVNMLSQVIFMSKITKLCWNKLKDAAVSVHVYELWPQGSGLHWTA